MGETLSRDLISYEQDINILRSADSTFKAQSDIVSKLLRRGKKLNKPDENGDTAMHKASATGNEQFLETLLKKYESVLDQGNMDGLNPFQLAVLYGKVECAKKILEINPILANSKFVKNPIEVEYSMKGRSGRYVFTVNNYSKIEERKVCSDPFFIGRIQWRLVLYPKGSKSEEYISIYLEVMDCDVYPERWYYFVNFKFSLLNPLTGEESNTRIVRAHKFSKNHPDLGFPQFVKRSKIINRKSGLIPRDRLVILFENEIIESHGHRFHEMNGMYTWNLENAIKAKERVVSNEFCLGGFSWVIIAYPKGKSNSNFLSLYLKVSNSDSLPNDWFVIASFSMSIIDQISGYKFTRTIPAIPFATSSEDWGMSQFAFLPSLYGHEFGFINYGTLTIEAKIEIIDSYLKHKTVYSDTLASQDFVPLHWAVYMNHIEGINELLSKGAHLEAKDKNGRTALDWAAYNGKLEAVILLLEKGAIVDSRDNEGYTPLHKAIISGSKSIVNLLLSKGAFVNSVPKKRKSSLVRSVKLLRDSGSHEMSDGDTTLDLKPSSVETIAFHSPLQMAILLNHGIIAELLICQYNADVNIVDQSGMSPLHYAAYRRDFLLMSLLIESDANVNLQDTHGYTPLHKSIWSEEKVCVDLLLSSGANPTLQASDGSTALHLAIKLNNLSIVKTILKYSLWRGQGKTDIEEDEDNLHDSVVDKKYGKLKSNEERTSKKRKSDPGVRSKDLLFFLSKPDLCNTYPAKDMDDINLKRGRQKKGKMPKPLYVGPDILDIRCSEGCIPLLKAISQGNLPIALYLIRKGSDVNTKNIQNMKPIDIALQNHDIPMITLLLENGAKILKSASSILQLASKRLPTVPLFKEDVEIPKSTFSSDMIYIINNPEYSDIEFEVEGESVYAWKGILCARSEFFRAMFHSSLKESSINKITINDVSHSVFLKIVHYIYTDYLDVSSLQLDEAIRVLSVSDRYILKRLKKMVEMSLVGQIEENNVVTLFLSADLYEAPSLRLACIYFMVSNSEIIANVEDIANYASFSTSLAEILKKSFL